MSGTPIPEVKDRDADDTALRLATEAMMTLVDLPQGCSLKVLT